MTQAKVQTQRVFYQGHGYGPGPGVRGGDVFTDPVRVQRDGTLALSMSAQTQRDKNKSLGFTIQINCTNGSGSEAPVYGWAHYRTINDPTRTFWKADDDLGRFEMHIKGGVGLSFSGLAHGTWVRLVMNKLDFTHGYLNVGVRTGSLGEENVPVAVQGTVPVNTEGDTLSVADPGQWVSKTGSHGE